MTEPRKVILQNWADEGIIGQAAAAALQADPTKTIGGAPTGVYPLSIPTTLGTRVGPASDGVLVGAITSGAVAAAINEDNSGTSFTDLTTEANEATGGDVVIPDPFDTDDALYIGASGIFSAVKIDMTVAGAGDAVSSELAYEYWDGDSWEALTEVEDSSAGLTAGTSTYLLSFLPPSDWAATTINSQGPYYFIRIRATADDVYNTTQPTMGQLWVYELDAGQGFVIPWAGTVAEADLMALTASATNDDSEFLLVNLTQGTFEQITWTGGDAMDRVTGLALAHAADDQLALQMIAEDGTTEFANVSIILHSNYA